MIERAGLRSNVEQWKQLQDRDYFGELIRAQGHGAEHPFFGGSGEAPGLEQPMRMLAEFVPLRPDMRVVVIGCGYGRETLKIAPQVGHVHGIDVSSALLKRAVEYLAERKVRNFTPVLADDYRETIPAGIDLVFSFVVMQHLTRDLVNDYFISLAAKLVPGGSFVVQFLESLAGDGAESGDAELAVYEPSVTWTSRQLVELCARSGLEYVEVRTMLVHSTALWHWAHFRR